MNILIINAGSSSLKYQMMDPQTGEVSAKGLCERIGIDGHLKHTPLCGDKPVFNEDVAMPTHSEAIQAVMNALVDEKNGVIGSMKEIDAVGHRVLHGGWNSSIPASSMTKLSRLSRSASPWAPCTTPLT